MTMFDQASVPEPLRSVREAAAHLRVSESTIRRMVRSGALPDRRVGAQLRFAPADLDAVVSGRSAATVDERADVRTFVTPDWAEERVARWRAQLSNLIPSGDGAQAIVIDRRGSKAFEVLRPSGFVWGKNLWHSDGLEVVSDEDLFKIFDGHNVFLFDELVQRGRDLYRLKRRLADVGIGSRSVCLVRRRSAFLAGELKDLDVEAIDDLSDDEFREAAAFLSRLFDYTEPPLDPEHVLVSGRSQIPNLVDELGDRLDSFGAIGQVWNRSSRHDAAIAALTIDRPYFFDVDACTLPDGLRAEWDGPCKARPYVSYLDNSVGCAFITYPTLRGSDRAWRDAARKVDERYGSTRWDGESQLDDAHVVRTYVDICTDISIELLRQAVASGLFAQLGVAAPAPPRVANLAAFFGPRRAEELHRQIRAALEEPPKLPIQTTTPVCVAVDTDRRLGIVVDPVRARRAILTSLPHRAAFDERHASGITYRELLVSTRPVAESSVSVALDGLIDGVDVKPVERIARLPDGGIEVARAFVGSEYGDDLLDVSAVHTYDVQQTKRTVAVSVAALEQWLRLRDKNEETELTVAKLLVNLAHDWPRDSPLAIRPYANKHGYMPALNTDVPYVRGERRYLIRDLLDARLISEHRKGTQSLYRVSDNVDCSTLLAGASLSGPERAALRGLVRAYAAIQSRIKVTRPLSHRSASASARSDPLVLLSSARNERTVFSTGKFEIGDWARIGRHVFRMLSALEGRPADGDFRRSLGKSLREFAQASAFLFNKLAVYEAVGQFRCDVAALVDELDLDHGEILLDTIDVEPRFAMDYADSEYPVGLLRRAWTIMRPFTSFLRQLLTQLQLEADTRANDALLVADDETAVKDLPHYATELAEVLLVWDIPFNLQRVPEEVALSSRAGQLDFGCIKKVGELFEAILAAIRATVRDEGHAEAAQAVADRRRSDLIRIAKELSETDGVEPGHCIAVGDFYNFVGMVKQLATITGASEAAMGERAQGWMEDTVNDIGDGHPRALWRVAADNVVIVAPTADDAVGAAFALNESLRQKVESWDRDEAQHVGWMRFGVSMIDEEVFGAVIEAYRLSDTLRLPRGTFVMSHNVHCAMSLVRDRFTEQSLESGETVWLFNPK
jgi:excisionase family DNA binding protein